MSTSDLPLLKRNPALQAVISGCETPPILREILAIVAEAVAVNVSPDGRSYAMNSGDGRIAGPAMYLEAPIPASLPSYKPGFAFLVLQAELPENFVKADGMLPLPRHPMLDAKIRAIEASPEWRAQCRRMKRKPCYAQGLFGFAVRKSGELEVLATVPRYLDKDGQVVVHEPIYANEIGSFAHGALHNALILLNGGTSPDRAVDEFEEVEEDMPPATSNYYEWLLRHKDTPGDIGKLARHAEADPLWPRNESGKEALRAHLRKSGNKNLVIALAMSFGTFLSELPDNAEDEERGLAEFPEETRNLTKPAVTKDLSGTQALTVALGVWFDLGEPSPTELQKMVKAQSPGAMCVMGIRHMAGVAKNSDSRLGRELLEKAFYEHKFAAAGAALSMNVELDITRPETIRKRTDLLVAAARMGDKNSAATVLSMIGAPKEMTGIDLRGKEGHDLLIAYCHAGGHPGDIIWRSAQAMTLSGPNESAASMFEEAIKHRCPKAYADLADIREAQGKEEEAEELRLTGIDEGDTKCGMDLGWKYVKETDDEDALSDAAEWITRAARAGHVDAIGMLGTLYLDGIGVKEDEEYGKFLLLMSGFFQSELALGEISERGFTGPQHFDPKRMAEWLTDCARETREPEIMDIATRVRHDMAIDG